MPFWEVDWSNTGAKRPVLPFVNRNHYAGFVTMGLLASVGLFLAILTRSTGKLNRRALREAISDGAWATPRLIAAGLAIALGLTGIVLSGSRGGFLALAGGLAFAVLARRLRAWVVPAVAAVVLAGLLSALPSMVGNEAGEFQQAPFVSGGESSGLLRMDAWTKTGKLFLDFPLTGCGLGAFRWAFSMYQRQGEWMIFREAHNDYLQVLAETGLVGVALLGWALFAYLWWILRPALAGAARPRYTTIGAAAAVFALLIHSIFDFNLQIPSNAALFAVLVGVVVAAAGDEPPPGGSDA
jgi:O-antigen ligase